jgi:hypothetical protein
VQDVRDLLMSAITPNPYLDRRAFGVTMRSFLKNYGLKAYKDGLSQGGVNVEALDPDDNAEYMRVFVEQSQYVSGFAEDVFVKKAVNAGNIQDRALMWGKSLQAFNDEGLASADANGMYMYRRGLTSDSCVDCRHLDGQVHRLKTFKKRGKMPRSNRLACKGYRCLCYLERTTERARGRKKMDLPIELDALNDPASIDHPPQEGHTHEVKSFVATPRDLGVIGKIRTWLKSELKPGIHVVHKDNDPLRYMILITSNSYEDREKETITTKALEEYEASCYPGEGLYHNDNRLVYWHDDDAPIGEIIAVNGSR